MLNALGSDLFFALRQLRRSPLDRTGELRGFL
jgi:hypothetical protein